MRDRRVFKKESHALSFLVGPSQPSCCDHFEIVVDTFWIGFAITLDFLRIELGSLWDHFGIILESFWDRSGIELGLILYDFLYLDIMIFMSQVCRVHLAGVYILSI